MMIALSPYEISDIYTCSRRRLIQIMKLRFWAKFYLEGKYLSVVWTTLYLCEELFQDWIASKLSWVLAEGRRREPANEY